jgi:GMP synthase PP-ATPase subunit
MTSILDKVTRLWGIHRSDPVERALNRAITAIDEQVPRGNHVVLGYSGGLTSVVSGFILKRVIHERITACYVQTGLEYSLFQTCVTENGLEINVVDARQRILDALEGTVDVPERKRRICRIIRDACLEAYPTALLSQGATYESLLYNTTDPALQSKCLVQPLENLTRGEVELIANQHKLKVMTSSGQPFGYATTIRGPFSVAALQLCRTVDRILGQQIANMKTPIPGVRIRLTFVVDIWDRNYPQIIFGFEESDNGTMWRRMRMREGGLDMVVDVLRCETGIRDLKVAYDVTLPL